MLKGHPTAHQNAVFSQSLSNVLYRPPSKPPHGLWNLWKHGSCFQDTQTELFRHFTVSFWWWSAFTLGSLRLHLEQGPACTPPSRKKKTILVPWNGSSDSEEQLEHDICSVVIRPGGGFQGHMELSHTIGVWVVFGGDLETSFYLVKQEDLQAPWFWFDPNQSRWIVHVVMVTASRPLSSTKYALCVWTMLSNSSHSLCTFLVFLFLYYFSWVIPWASCVLDSDWLQG